MNNKEHIKDDHSALLREIDDILAKINREREMVVMANSQLVEPPHQGPGKVQTLRDLRIRMEGLPDFDEQMRNNPHFKKTYENLLAGIKL